MQEFEIRQAAPEDAEAMLAYLKQVGGETDNLSFGAEGLPGTEEQERAYLASMAEDAHSVCLVACRDGKIIGSGSLNGMPRRMGHRAELGITVQKADWNGGVGSRLMERLIAYAQEQGTEVIHLEVRSDNARAIHLYEKFGFRSIGTFPAYLKINGAYVDAEIMVRDLR